MAVPFKTDSDRCYFRHYPVKIIGKCGPLTDFSKRCPRSAYKDDCIRLVGYVFSFISKMVTHLHADLFVCRRETSKYPFFLALENSICNDYVTEKYWHRIYVNSIPIVWSRRSFGKK